MIGLPMEQITYHDTLTYRLDDFEGPLDLLLALIEKNKMDIHDIPIVSICDQYMAYLAEAQTMDLDIASEFIIMASKLMLIKSRMLLPGAADREDPRKELVNQLELYMATKKAASELKPLFEVYSGRYTRTKTEIPPEKGVPMGLDPTLLSDALNEMLARINVIQPEPELMISPLIQAPIVSVEKKIEEIVAELEQAGTASLLTLLLPAPDKAELMARFMGVLELVKLGRILICRSVLDDRAEDIPEESTEASDIRDESYNATANITIAFKLNPDYVPGDEEFRSEYDYTPEEDTDDTEDDD